MSVQKIEIKDYFRDKNLLGEIITQVQYIQKVKNCIIRRILLPKEVLYPILTEISFGMVIPYTPTLYGFYVEISPREQMEVAIEYYPKGLKTSPILVDAKPYKPDKKEYVVFNGA